MKFNKQSQKSLIKGGFLFAPLFSLGAMFAAQSTFAQEHYVCVCTACVAASTESADGSVSDELRYFTPPFDRWFSNANAAGFTGVRGDAITLTYGIVPDGTSIGGTAVTGENAADTSNLISFLNANIGSSAVWQPLIDDAYQRWGEVSGLTMIHEANDDGAAMGSGGALGATGVRADMRIGGRFLDGQVGSNTLAYNYSPSNGDHVVDTGNTSFYSNSSGGYIGFRNVFMHEAGHGLGLAHTIPTNGTKLMEPFINTSFDGPQFDDILAVQRQYGDAREASGGNDTTGTATSLGVLTPASTTIGDDASDSTPVVGANDIDFVSIDGTTDVDVFGFSLSALSDLTIILDPKGPTYDEGPQSGSTSSFNTKALNDLMLELLDSGGSVITSVDINGAGTGETIVSNNLAAGNYYARVSVGSGDVDQIQMYSLDLSAVVIPEPSSLALLGLGGLLIARRRRG